MHPSIAGSLMLRNTLPPLASNDLLGVGVIKSDVSIDPVHELGHESFHFKIIDSHPLRIIPEVCRGRVYLCVKIRIAGFITQPLQGVPPFDELIVIEMRINQTTALQVSSNDSLSETI